MLFNLFNKKKNNVVNLHDYESVYADSFVVILDSENSISVISHEGTIAVGEWNVHTKHGATKYFSSLEELFAHYNIVNSAMQARIAKIVVDYAL